MISRALLFCFLGLLASPAFASTLTIRNLSDQGIINILAATPGREFFLRLDLLPGGSDSFENPACEANLRADTGLEFWSFRNVDLAAARQLVFCGRHPVCLAVEQTDGKERHINGVASSLVPRKGEKPVCSLDQFRPGMTMAEVCDLLADTMPRDDNGAILAGLGFAGLPWAGRLIPTDSGAMTPEARLRHLELRRPLNAADAERTVRFLVGQGYVPWQGEFPGKDIEFAEKPAKAAEELALAAIGDFLKVPPGRHKNHAAGEKCAAASILFAPKADLPALANSDEPDRDIRIFTLALRPCAHTLLLDIAAYGKDEAANR